jgi:hypothetical protein
MGGVIAVRLPNAKVGIQRNIMGADKYKSPAPSILRNCGRKVLQGEILASLAAGGER